MKQNTYFLGFGGREKTFQIIIGILASEWPLSISALHKRLTQKHSRNISYQATHKIVKKMLREKIIEQINKRYYRLSVQWIKGLKSFSSELQRAYLNKEGELEFPV